MELFVDSVEDCYKFCIGDVEDDFEEVDKEDEEDYSGDDDFSEEAFKLKFNTLVNSNGHYSIDTRSDFISKTTSESWQQQQSIEPEDTIDVETLKTYNTPNSLQNTDRKRRVSFGYVVYFDDGATKQMRTDRTEEPQVPIKTMIQRNRLMLKNK